MGRILYNNVRLNMRKTVWRIIMAKLYFKYGSMGSSKTAQALITKYNYEEKGMTVWLVKPSADTRDGEVVLRSRVGLEANAEVVAPQTDVLDRFSLREKVDVIIVDECQFMTTQQIDQLRYIVDVYNIPVLCFGLRTDFLSTLFDGSRRLFEVADTISEIKAICDCGAKATTNARIDAEGYIVTEGDQLLLGGNDRYLAMCHKCWIRNIREHRKVK
jgi:thymidine kinase